MEKFIAFIRINKNNVAYTKEQVIGLKEYVNKHNIEDYDAVDIEINLPSEEQNMRKLLEDCKKGCSLIAYDLNVFGRTTEAILEMIKLLVENEVRVIVVKQGLDLSRDDMLSQIVIKMIKMMIDLEKDLMSIRTKEALSAKKIAGMNLGKPKGTIQKSKFDEQREKIEELLAVGLSTRKIAKLLGYNNHIGLNNYIKKRNIRQKVQEENESLEAS